MSAQAICYIFGAGERVGVPAAAVGDYVIAADGGLAYAEACGITPDLVVGDFDSLPEPPTGYANTVVLPMEKDDTDMVAALRHGWARGYRLFHIYGGTGGRLDHTLANIQCLADIAERGGRGVLFERETKITAICNESIAFPSTARGTISVFCHSQTATGVYERGLQYALEDATLKNTYPLGISNAFVGKESMISVAQGTLVILFPRDVLEAVCE